MRDLIFGLLEAAYGLGFTLGPLIGQVLYAKYGFKVCFLVISSILAVPLLLIGSLKFTKEDYINQSRDRSRYNENLTYFNMLRNKRTITCLAALFACIVCMIFYEPLLTN